jgi:hypothetical protein
MIADNDKPADAESEVKRIKGRFAPGCSGNPGGENANARRARDLRRALLNAIEPADMERIAKGMLAAAEDGDSAAANVLLRYTIGEAKDTEGMDDAREALLRLFRPSTLEAMARDRGMPDGVV